MGQKVNFNNKKTNNLKILVIIILIIVVAVVLLKSAKDVMNSRQNSNEDTNKAGTSTVNKQFSSLEELLKSYECKLISKTETYELLTAEIDFKYNLYSGDVSNENFFLNLCKAIVEFEDYRNLKLNDKAKDIDIEVTCENKSIIEFKINGDVNYYLNNDSRLNRNKTYKITEFSIQSEELKTLMDNNWDETKVEFGTRESMYSDYNIFFDEGIRYKTVGKNIFNIVFTEYYNGEVAAKLKPTATTKQVLNALGDPTFSNGEMLYGYVGEDAYLFFDFLNKQISVYPVVKVTKDDEKKLLEYVKAMNESHDIKIFATDLIDNWSDYDLYNYDVNYVDLRYTLKGVQLSIYGGSLKNGVYIYQNYSGDRSIADLENVYIKETDAVYDSEYARSMGEAEKAYKASQQNNAESELYHVELITDKNGDIIKVGFISVDGTRPDVEISDSFYTYVWLNESQILYSVQNKGIYYYDFDTFTKRILIEGKEDFKIKSYENNILTYDDTSVKVEE